MTVPAPPGGVDPRSRLLATGVLAVGLASLSPLPPARAAVVALGLLALAGWAGVSPGRLLARSTVVLPVAGSCALFTLLREATGWTPSALAAAWASSGPAALSLVLTSWVCVLPPLLLAATTPGPELLAALARLGAPSALVTLLAFMLRYGETLRAQVRATRRALLSRAPGLTPRREALLYGNLAGSLLLRAHDRGERVHAAMLARGFTGGFPTPPVPPWSGHGLALVGAALLAVGLLAGLAGS